MIDLKYIQKNFDISVLKLSKKNVDKKILLKIKSIFEKLKSINLSLDELREFQNKTSKLFPIYKKEKKDTYEIKQKLDKNKIDISNLNEESRNIEDELKNITLNIPNFPDDTVPEGEDENDNIEIKKILDIPKFNFKPKEHWELAEKNGWIDFKNGVKLAKSRFSILKKDGAKLERALINFFLDSNTKEGFEEVSVPVLNNYEMLQGTGQLPKFEEDLFKIENENLYLIPTGEVPLTNIFYDEIIEEKNLPILMTGVTQCFRREAGSAGRDTRGMIRQHQFSKVEIVAISHPQESEDIFDKMVQTSSDILKALELPHRLVELCSGDLSFSASRTVDLEVWLPAQKKYREISSISNTRDFQARRAKIRYKNRNSRKNSLVHTLNGSSLAVGRTIIAIMENFQQENGEIKIPKILDKYL